MIINKLLKPVKTVFVSTYPPRQCGIATYTYDICSNLNKVYGTEKNEGARSDYLQVVAVNNSGLEKNNYTGNVCFSIKDQHLDDYQRVADYINLSPVEVVSLQHEFGIYGGEEGSYILHFLDKLKKPVVTTFHTVLKNPTPNQKKIINHICLRSTLVIVMAQRAVTMLKEIYGVPEEKIMMIHHGAPDIPFLDSSYYKEQFMAEGRRIILTFGLLDNNKGMEYVIEAMSEVVKNFPEALFMIVGVTHPEAKRKFGEKYRNLLEKTVKEKGLQDNVVFQNHYVSIEQLIQFLIAADIYITPYLGKERITSGTLAYALAAGKAIISTPYHYAEELLAGKRGTLVPFKNSSSIAQELKVLLGDEKLRNQMRKNAYQFGRKMIWANVAEKYAGAFSRALYEYGRTSDFPDKDRKFISETLVKPEVNFSHLRRMTNHTGLLQHAVYSVPDRKWGYSTKDNARALIVSTLNWKMFKEEQILPLVDTYLGLLNHALDYETGEVKGKLKYNGDWQEEADEVSHGCMLFALGWTVSHPPTDAILGMSARLFQQSVGAAMHFDSLPAQAYAVLGALHYLERFNGETQALEVATTLSRQLMEQLDANTGKDWIWFDGVVGEDNARLPQALIFAGQQLNNERMLTKGIEALDWLISVQTSANKHLSLIGNGGWLRAGEEKARFNQRPSEANALIDACQQAFLATKDTRWHEAMEWAFNWFFGDNDMQTALYDYNTGGCYDRLQPAGVNFNQGGESLACFLLSLHRLHQVAYKQVLLNAEKNKKFETTYHHGMGKRPSPKAEAPANAREDKTLAK